MTTIPSACFACPLSEVVRVHSSSGTTGSSPGRGLTRNDVETWAGGVMARTLACGGAGPHDIIKERLWLRDVHGRPGDPLRRREDVSDHKA